MDLRRCTREKKFAGLQFDFFGLVVRIVDVRVKVSKFIYYFEIIFFKRDVLPYSLAKIPAFSKSFVFYSCTCRPRSFVAFSIVLKVAFTTMTDLPITSVYPTIGIAL